SSIVGSSIVGGATTTAHLVAALSLAGDMGIGVHLEHCLRTCYISLHVAATLGLDDATREDVFWTALLKDAGCTSFATQIAAFVNGDEIAARRQFLVYADNGKLRDMFEWAFAFVGAQSGPLARA